MAVRREQFVNDSSTTLNEALDNSETVITITSGAVFPADGDFRVIVDDEVMLCTSRATNDLTVVRGVDGTSAVTHSDGATIKAVNSANNYTALIDDASGIGPIAQGGNSNRKPFRLLDDNNVALTSSDFSWVNQNSAVVTDDPFGGMTVKIPDIGGGTNWSLLYKTPPTAPYILTVNLLFGPGVVFGSPGNVQGIGWGESDTTKFVLGSFQTGAFMSFNRFNSTTSFSGPAQVSNATEFEWNELWLEMEDNNTQLQYRVSMDGLTYYTVGLDARTAWLTSAGPDRIFWAFNEFGGVDKLMHLRAWIEE